MEAKELKKTGFSRTRDARRAPRPRRTQEERSAQTRHQLVEAAIHVLQKWGYANLTISKVADRAGLTNGAMQHHFATREELVIAVLDALYPVLEIPFEDIASRKWDVKERVSAFVDLLWQIYSRPEYLVIWDIAFGTRGDAPLKAKLQAYQRDISGRVRKQLAASFTDVGLTTQDAEQLFAVIISCLRGFALQAVFAVDRRRSDLDYVKQIAGDCLAKYSTRKK